MIEIIDSNRLIEQVIDKHNGFLNTFKSEFSEIEGRLDSIRQQSLSAKKEIEAKEDRITVLNEKYYLFFHQAKKLREELFSKVIEKMRHAKAPNIHDIMRISGKIDEFEKRLQNSKNIEDEEKIIVEIKKLLYDFESEARKAGLIVTGKGVVDVLNEANSSHKELISLQNKPKQDVSPIKLIETQLNEIEGRHNWLKRRIESHNNAVAYWEKQKEVIKVD